MAEAVTIRVLPEATRFVVRGSADAIGRIGRAFGVDPSHDACRAATNGIRSALWLGPDEWLLIAPDGEGPFLFDAMRDGLGELPASVVEVSDRNVGIEVAGTRAADVINAFNPLDLGGSAFPVGMCTRTVFGKAEIVLWRTGPDVFRIEAWRSFVPYVLGQLDEATLEFRT